MFYLFTIWTKVFWIFCKKAKVKIPGGWTKVVPLAADDELSRSCDSQNATWTTQASQRDELGRQQSLYYRSLIKGPEIWDFYCRFARWSQHRGRFGLEWQLWRVSLLWPLPGSITKDERAERVQSKSKNWWVKRYEGAFRFWKRWISTNAEQN